LLRILHVEDDPLDRDLVAETLRQQGLTCEITAVDTRDDFARALESGGFDIILADDRLPRFDGQSALALAVERAPDVPFIFVSGTLGEEIAVERLKAGATDYVLKQRLARLVSSVDRALRDAQARREHTRAQEAKLFFEDLIAASPSMIFRVDPREFKITYASPNVGWLLGYGVDEIVGVRNFWRTVLHHDDLDRAATHLRQALEAHAVQVHQEYRFRSKDGRYRWFFSLMRVEYDDGGRPKAILWYCIDISDRRAAEQALLDSEERTRAILRTANDAFVGADPSGRIVEWNERAEAVFGWSREEVLGRILADTIVPEQYRDRHRQGFARSLQTVNPRVLNQRLELTAVRRDGSEFPVELTIWSTGDADQRVFNAFIRDITEQKRNAAIAAQARQEAERANRAKSDFLSRMSHELRTPLNAVLGFAQLLMNEPLAEEAHDSVHQILKGGRHLLDLINEVLDISRIEAGRLSLSLEPVGVRDVVRHVADLVAPLTVDRNIVLVVDDIDPAHTVVADRQRLGQILLNLISNAVKYNRTNGRVTVGFDSLSASRLRITVTDTGTGIRPEKIQLLFNPFERLGAEATGIEGTGLGLALSRGLAEAMGAALGVSSEVDRGSTFWIDLNRSTETAIAAPAGMSAGLLGGSATQPATILYIEDNVSNVRLMTRLLARRPAVTLLHAGNGRTGIAMARSHAPDAIFLDLHLPDMSGEDVLRQLWEDPAVRPIPVVMLTADATPAQMRRALASGAAAYLTKPLDLRKVLDTLDQMLSLSEERRAPRS
jgi:PAS domain S-box-containing protein